jgi:hypothetical protein
VDVTGSVQEPIIGKRYVGTRIHRHGLSFEYKTEPLLSQPH